MTQITADFSGAIRQTASLLKLNKAHKFVATEWAADTVRILKMRARAMQKAGQGRKTGHLARNIGMLVGAQEERWTVVVGTGIGGTQSVRYAKIQDEGGEIRPRNKKFLTVPFPGVLGSARDYKNSFVLKTVSGNLLIAEKHGDDWRPLFHLVKRVKMPATHWFSGVLEYRERDLSEMMAPDHILKVAQGMAGVK